MQRKLFRISAIISLILLVVYLGYFYWIFSSPENYCVQDDIAYKCTFWEGLYLNMQVWIFFAVISIVFIGAMTLIGRWIDKAKSRKRIHNSGLES
jgi:hypothetical protein